MNERTVHGILLPNLKLFQVGELNDSLGWVDEVIRITCIDDVASIYFKNGAVLEAKTVTAVLVRSSSPSKSVYNDWYDLITKVKDYIVDAGEFKMYMRSSLKDLLKDLEED